MQVIGIMQWISMTHGSKMLSINGNLILIMLDKDQNLKVLSLMEWKVTGMLSNLLAPVAMLTIGNNHHLAIIRIVEAG